MIPKALVLRTAGTNCDAESVHALKLAGADVACLHIAAVKKKNTLSSYQILCIPGGFSYGDDLGAGKIFALEFTLWLKEALAKLYDNGGLIIGICNGFQVLVKAGLLPDMDFTQKVTLTFNDSLRFEDRWTYLALEQSPKAPVNRIWAKGLPPVFNLPVAHGEGKFYADKAILDRIEDNQQVAFRYVDAHGRRAGFPFNPNGSLRSIAGITDSEGRILGLMPHPERFMFKHHYPFRKDQAQTHAWGLTIFKNAVAFFTAKERV